MTEPTAAPLEPSGGTVAQEAWDEPRGPHLPDAITRQSWLVWPFLLLIAIEVAVAWRSWLDEGTNIGLLVPIVREGIADVAAVGLGAAFFWRHPDGLRRLPLIAFSVILFAAQEVLRLLGGPLQDVFARLTPADEATSPPPRSTSRRPSPPISSSDHATRLSAIRGVAPMAYTSERALAAATRPKS